MLDTPIESVALTLKQVEDNGALSEATRFSSILVLHEEKITLLGDCCVAFSRIRHLKKFFDDVPLTMNFTDKHNTKYIQGLLKNNPHINTITELQWEDIAFQHFDLIICIMLDERKLLHFLDQHYGALIRNEVWKPAIYSLSRLMFEPEQAHFVFPANSSLNNYMIIPRYGELYISAEERAWARQWLYGKGLRQHEKLSILIDTSSYAGKLLNNDVYFEILEYILNKENNKVLIFDENNSGKEALYRSRLNDTQMQRIIFSKGLTLREDLCLLGSEHVNLVFGPCSGLMHCASGIYNNYVSNGLLADQVPLLTVYTGLYGEKTYSLQNWWGESPLINCLLLRKEAGEYKLLQLRDLPREGREDTDRLPCSEYPASLLITFLNSRLK